MFYGYWENKWPFNRHLYKWDPCLHSIIYFQIIKSAIQMLYDSLPKKKKIEGKPMWFNISGK